MPGPPTSEVVAGIYSVIVGAALLCLGYLIVDVFLAPRGWDTTARWGLALAGVCGYSLTLMVVHMATRGALFTNPWLVRAPTAAVALGLIGLKWRRRSIGELRWLIVALAVAALVWGTPVFRMLPLTATADTQLHNGWINQLMNGETTPGAVITGNVPNYYPWLFHALGGLTTLVTPGRNPYYALGALQFLITGGAVLAWFALGRTIARSTAGGVAASLFGALAGGVGFVLLRGLDVVVDPRHDEGRRALDYGGDLLFARSYSLSFQNLAPPFPRDLAFGLTVTFVLLLSLAVIRPTPRRFALAGLCLGLVGLTGGETVVASMLVGLAVVFFGWGLARARAAVSLFVPAAAVYSLWLVPVTINYVRLGGFENITHIESLDLPAYAVLGAWGVTTPFAILGAASAMRSARIDVRARFVLVTVVGLVVALVVASVIPSLGGEGFATLARRHRYWPLVYLGAALLATLGAARAFDLLQQRRRMLIPATTTVVALALASPVLASTALPDRIRDAPLLEDALHRAPDSVLNVIDRAPGRSCIVAVPQDISREVFSYTGYRLVLWTGSWFGANRARIRWAEIYDHIATDAQRIRDNRILVNGWGTASRWRGIAASYGVDIVVAPAGHEHYGPFRGFRVRRAGDYVVFTLDRCGA